MPEFKAFLVEVTDKIARVVINRAQKRNAMNQDFWRELPEVFAFINDCKAIRVVILSGQGEHFSAGMDLSLLMQMASEFGQDALQNAEQLRQKIIDLQSAVAAIDHCKKPVLAVISGYCLGAALDLVCACDMRYASDEAQFAIREIDLALVADLGSLQRLPRLIGDGMTRELAYSGRLFGADEAQQIGLLQRTWESPAALQAGVLEIARQIAQKSPLAIRASKQVLNHAREHRIASGLDHVATLNAGLLQGKDPALAVRALMSKQTATFAD
ncbi:enoyl-CoA hydratase [Ventosimonas gracilis]|uniref:Enoyl-CoA hydratase n=1 Tax=Ventosimonas gracilis TaxID=1680762 RepID=A0A139SRU9_9GAMM|nr:crotonase/enoyl-CoA hydratase family protein [Ventosimonas gracilis]KXU37278.1 enoyl-CoA hydratase [Ventosimonas gracilis]